MSLARWAAALDDFERALSEQCAFIAAGRPEEVVAFLPPPDLGPLPDELAPRAASLLQAAQGLVGRLQALAASHHQELALLDRMRPAASGPSYVDHAM